MRKKLILVVSERMDSNRKEGRNENGLIRMSATTRDYMGFEDRVELWSVGATGEDRLNKSILLKIFHAYSGDIKKAKEDVRNGKLSKEDLKRVGFVTTKMFNRICGDVTETAPSIWISDDIHDTMMGADPEFLLFNPDNIIVSARNVLPYHGEIGSDGPMAEIRPKPEVSTEALVDNMVGIFKKALDNEYIKGYKWKASCFYYDGERGYPVGGHIHIGSPAQIASRSTSFKISFYRVANKIIDEYITIPLIKLDGPDGGKRRDSAYAFCGYGGYGDFRTDHGRLEHRSASGIWLLHPSVARAVLGTAKAVVDEIFKYIADNGFSEDYILPRDFRSVSPYDSSFDSWDEVPLTKDMRSVRSSGWMKNAMRESDKNVIDAQFIKGLYGRLKRMSTYNGYSKYIDGLHEILKLKYNDTSK